MNYIKVHQIKVGDIYYPYLLATGAIHKFCEMTGYKYQDVVDGDKFREIATLDQLLTLYWCGFERGHRLDKKEFTITKEDMIDLIDLYPDFLEQIITKTAEQNSPSPEHLEAQAKEAEEAKKKLE